ncbi:MAG: tripartite tricarboxylate transporter permease [Nanoarchaeota archaeon]|nr:tripartite tricarboxylate transporter permease [Nanoarchaeota archaeon]MBU4086242.1 tripartite tricarboxylate transporter permease [Nanoarchaeota archaeon]
MFLEIILALIVGIAIGTITGLIPGIHINLVSAIVVSSLAVLFLYFSPISIAVFIVSLSITHTFIDFIPSIFLGAPDESALSVLPGHKLLLEGKGYEAVIYTITGCLISIPLLIILAPIFMLMLPKLFFYLKFVMFLILISVSVYMISNNKNKFQALIIFLLSGFLGISTLFFQNSQPLLPLLSGLFGASSLISSIRKKEKLKEQKITKVKIKFSEIKQTFLTSLIASPLCSFLPALGSSQAAIIGANLQSQDKENSNSFLMLLGSVNFLVMALSFITLYSISKSRTGAAVAIQEILKDFNFPNLLVIILAVIISSLIAFLISIFLARIFSRSIAKINYTKLSISIIVFLSIVILIFSKFPGLLLYLVSTIVGLFCIESGARRTNLMGCLMLPSILLYLPI